MLQTPFSVGDVCAWLGLLHLLLFITFCLGQGTSPRREVPRQPQEEDQLTGFFRGEKITISLSVVRIMFRVVIFFVTCRQHTTARRSSSVSFIQSRTLRSQGSFKRANFVTCRQHTVLTAHRSSLFSLFESRTIPSQGLFKPATSIAINKIAEQYLAVGDSFRE